MSDPLAEWWVHPVTITRWADDDKYGPGYGTPETLLGFIHDRTRMVAGPGGAQIASSATVALPKGTAYVPVDSKVTLPAMFGGRTCTVVWSDVGDGGGQPTPDHVELGVI